MMHNDQLKCFFVGGPNQRKDFHLEEGEELFYMRKGDMSLPILTEGRIRTVHIREGEVGREAVSDRNTVFCRCSSCRAGSRTRPSERNKRSDLLRGILQF